MSIGLYFRDYDAAENFVHYVSDHINTIDLDELAGIYEHLVGDEDKTEPLFYVLYVKKNNETGINYYIILTREIYEGYYKED